MLGLEHRGTTLLNHHLYRNENALGIGDVANFISIKVVIDSSKQLNFSKILVDHCGEIGL